MSLKIIGIGTAVPRHSITQPVAAEMAKAFCSATEKRGHLLQGLYHRSRINTRSSVLLESGNGSGIAQSFFPRQNGETDHGPTTRQRMERYAEEAVPLAQAASQRALAQSSVATSRISHLVTVSCTGFVAPGLDIALIKRLGLPPTIGRTHIGFMGCHGALNGLQVASAFAERSTRARILLCAVELCSLHFSYGWDPEKLVANALFADGAAALVARSSGRKTDTWRLGASGSCVFPDSEDAMTWRIGDHGFEMTLSARAPALITAYLRPWLVRWLGRQGLALSRIRSWAIHPGGPRLLETVAACLGLPERATAVSRDVLAEHGNMSSATLLFILERLSASGAVLPCVVLGFGPGLVVEAAILL